MGGLEERKVGLTDIALSLLSCRRAAALFKSLSPVLFFSFLLHFSLWHHPPSSSSSTILRTVSVNSFPAISSSASHLNHHLQTLNTKVLPQSNFTMRLSLAGAAISLLSYSAGVAAQTFSDCNPLEKSKFSPPISGQWLWLR